MTQQFTTWNSNLTVQKWAKEFFREARIPAFFEPFTGAGKGSVIQTKTELSKAKGDNITMGLVENLSKDAPGVTGDNIMAGNEVPIVTQSQNIVIDQLRQAVISEGRMNDKKTLLNFREEALGVLKTWFSEVMDQDLFTVIGASPTRTLGADVGGTPRIDSTSKSGLVAADKISLGDISLMKKLAKVPYTAGDYKIRPAKIKGDTQYICVLGSESEYDLKRDSEYNQIRREADRRGMDNSIFTGLLGWHDNVLLLGHENIAGFTDGGGASVRGEQNLFMGAQAGLLAFGGDFSWHEELVDRGNKLSITGGIIYEAAKAYMNSIDWAVISYYCATTKLAA